MNIVSESPRPQGSFGRLVAAAVLGAMLGFAMWGPLSDQFWSAWHYPSVTQVQR